MCAWKERHKLPRLYPRDSFEETRKATWDYDTHTVEVTVLGNPIRATTR
jgi:hypothetical protein